MNVYKKSFPYLRFLPVIYLLLFLAGCASLPYVPEVQQPTVTSEGIYHRVEKGQTLWKISKLYGIDLSEIARINHISDTASLEVGQLIFIPKTKPAHIEIQPSQYAKDDFIWPLKGRVIAHFGETVHHMRVEGIHIAPYSSSNSDVLASRSGTVSFCSNDFSGFGKTIIIDHGDGFSTVYARNLEVFVKPGDIITQGMRIGRAGYAGRDKEIYLHFEIRKGPAPENPYFYLPR